MVNCGLPPTTCRAASAMFSRSSRVVYRALSSRVPIKDIGKCSGEFTVLVSTPPLHLHTPLYSSCRCLVSRASPSQRGKSSLRRAGSRDESLPCFVQGWVKSVRKQKDIVFIDLNDGSTHQSLQIVARSEDFPRYTCGCTPYFR